MKRASIKIRDTSMKTRQQELQDILRKQGLCVTCGKLAAISTRTDDGYSRYCEIHKTKMAEYSKIYMRQYRINKI